MVLTIIDLQNQLKDYCKQKAHYQVMLSQCSGAIQAIEHQIKMLSENAAKAVEQLKLQQEKDKQNAIKEGQQPEDNISEHQDGEGSREATESSDCNSLEQSGEVNEQQEEVTNHENPA